MKQTSSFSKHLLSVLVLLVMSLSFTLSACSKAKAATDTTTSTETAIVVADEASPYDDIQPCGETVYVTPHGRKYHNSRSCRYLRRSKHVKEIDRAYAAYDHDPCSACYPNYDPASDPLVNGDPVLREE